MAAINNGERKHAPDFSNAENEAIIKVRLIMCTQHVEQVLFSRLKTHILGALCASVDPGRQTFHSSEPEKEASGMGRDSGCCRRPQHARSSHFGAGEGPPASHVQRLEVVQGPAGSPSDGRRTSSRFQAVLRVPGGPLCRRLPCWGSARQRN